MGVADRDWYREPPEASGNRGSRYALAAVVVAALLAFVVVTHVLPQTSAADPEHVTHRDEAIGIAPGLMIPIQRAPLYPPHDVWKAYLADEQTCPNAEDVNAQLHDQAETMICLINHARSARGLPPLPVSAQLSTAAQLKGAEIARCRVFAHGPCGGDPHDVADQAGFTGAWGENLYIADGRYGAPRPALDGWLNSPGHRANLFDPGWRLQSVYVLKLDDFPGFRSPTLWVSEFGA